ncbi:hypothetical protein B0H65DRAFT_442257 [Neurospora tetraspora]|uniref:Uncharacterized protein n=1 Tax=Neurospora tetraspora TaxID=94610 RepID=A0AAE0JEB4_9PEZI|nr:hypothetical protein B0H65DRAFT_442257 [Neurospora tetraspora]
MACLLASFLASLTPFTSSSDRRILYVQAVMSLQAGFEGRRYRSFAVGNGMGCRRWDLDLAICRRKFWLAHDVDFKSDFESEQSATTTGHEEGDVNAHLIQLHPTHLQGGGYYQVLSERISSNKLLFVVGMELEVELSLLFVGGLYLQKAVGPGTPGSPAPLRLGTNKHPEPGQRSLFDELEV